MKIFNIQRGFAMGKNILLLGNGFDIYHKMPTRYTDFLTFSNNWIIFKKHYKNLMESNNEHGNSENRSRDQFLVRLDKYGCLTEESIEDFGTHSYSYDFNKIQFLNEYLQNNMWIYYFNATNFSKVGWIDFEKEIENVLNTVELYYSSHLPNWKGKIPSQVMSNNEFSVMDAVAKHTASSYKINFLNMVHESDIYPEALHEQKQKILDTMKNELNILNKCLYIYFDEFISRIKNTVYSKLIKELRNVYLLNFNYTYTYKTIYGTLKLKEEHYIHGCLAEDNLVLGVQDDFKPSKANSLEYIYFLKYFQRIQKRTGSYYKQWIESVGGVNETTDTLHIMGHSLDKTDKGVLQDLFFSENIDKIFIYYHNQSSYELQVINLVDMFGKEYVINQTAKSRIQFIELEIPEIGILKTV
jgi:hypothetical protein